MKQRSTIFAMYIGYNRTGKSSIARRYANLWRINNPEGPIGGYDPQRKFQDLIAPEYQLYGGEMGWWYADKPRAMPNGRPICEMRNGLLIFDDYRGIQVTDKLSDDFMRLMEFRAEYSLDIIMICHSPVLVLPRLSPYISHYFIFYTKGPDSKFKMRVENYVECEQANQMMKAYVQDFPNVVDKHHELYDKSKNGRHKFPHIIVDTTWGKMHTQNMDAQWLSKHLNDKTIVDEQRKAEQKQFDKWIK